MTSHFGPLRLIVNPRAGSGTVGRSLPELRAALDRRGLDHDVVETTEPGHATAAAREALEEGLRFLVAVGGDGTVHEVVNGMAEDDRPVAPDAVLGVFAAGSGCDFIRTFGLDRSADVVAHHFSTDRVLPIDLGRIDYVDAQGNPASRLFANVAEVGYGAEVVRLAARLPRRLGRFRYLLAAWAAIRSLRRQETAVELDRLSRTTPVVEVVVANCQFFGGGMKVAPRALPDDGRFNVQVFTGERSQVFLLTTRMYRGDHLPHPQIQEANSRTVRVDPPEPLPVEADGELLGTTPARFAVVPRVLRLKI